jgi:hypothetical protein
MSSEVQETLQTYFNRKTAMRFFGDIQPVNEFLEYYQKGTWFTGDSPDSIILFENKCMIVEHFRFDCYKSTKKGSRNLAEQARIERAAKCIVPTEEGSIYRDEITGRSSYSHYIENIESVFKEHYRKIPQYKRNLLTNEVIPASALIEVAFLIEDVSPLGTVAHDGERLQPIILACSKPFLALLRNSPEVRFIIACSSYCNNNFVWLISREQIEEYERNSLDYANMDFIPFTPQVMGVKTIIPASDTTQFETTEDKQ